ncbi:MAG TPA: acyl-phosphate glycerol 3-phosphate acyltransferase [Clostridiales bacterium]|nr:acyl-phosphate glycerol 3-phosphate acyltransferase [Clostridiales bacterium]
MNLTVPALAVLAYLAGSVPVGLLVGRMVKRVDLRDHGSGNIGAANAMRVLGPGWAAVVLVLDAAKGFLPVLAGRLLELPAPALAVVAFLAVAGHNWSAFLVFRGGKGVATSLGILAALDPVVALAAMASWLFVVAVTRYASVGSLLGLAVAAAALPARGHPPGIMVLGLVLLAVAVWRHRSNIGRLVRGEELRFGQRVDPAEEGR